MNIADLFAEYSEPEYSSVEEERPLTSTPNGLRLDSIFRNELYTESFTATLFWQILVDSSLFAEILRNTGASVLAFTHAEKFIVCHGNKDNPRYDLIVLDPYYDREEPSFSYINFPGEEPDVFSFPYDHHYVTDAFRKWRRKRLENLILLLRRNWKLPKSVFSLLLNILRLVDENIVYECVRAKRFGILVVRSPRILATSVPSSPLKIYSPPYSKNATATAGVIVSQNRKIGVTIPLHASRKKYIQERVSIGEIGRTGLIKSTDEVSDSAFVEVAREYLHDVELNQDVIGPLSGKSPRSHEKAYFNGISSGKRTAIVIAWSPDLPFVSPYNQLKVLTTPETDPGDSGAALINDEGHILGFSFYRTGVGELVEYSAWIWADSVFAAHKLKIFQNVV